jgi:hypothetical protein
MDFKPSAERKARYVTGLIFDSMDAEERRRNPKSKTKGKRSEFLEKYKLKGYEVAKKEINAKFKKEVYNDETLKKWIDEEK